MTAEFRLLLRPELHAQLHDRQQPAETIQALRTGLRAIAEGREREYGAERLGYSPSAFDLRDCTQIEVGAHLLIYREFDDRAAIREAVCFGHTHPYEVAAQRLGRMAVRPDPGLITFPTDVRETFNAASNPEPAWRAVIETPHAPTASTFRNYTQAASVRQR